MGTNSGARDPWIIESRWAVPAIRRAGHLCGRAQTYFALEAKDFAAFQAMLDRPPAPTERLRRTLKARAPWDTAAATGKVTGPRAK